MLENAKRKPSGNNENKFKVNKKDPKTATKVCSEKTLEHRILSVNTLTTNAPIKWNQVNKFILKNNQLVSIWYDLVISKVNFFIIAPFVAYIDEILLSDLVPLLLSLSIFMLSDPYLPIYVQIQ